MILVCPSCDAKFKIPDGAIPAEGRTVRCANCKNSWHAKPNDIMRKKPAPVRRAAAPKPAGVQKQAAAHKNFDGQVDAKAAAEAEALRRSVRTVVEEVEASPVASPIDDDVFDDGDSDAKPIASGDDADDFGIADAARAALGDDFDDDPAVSAPEDGSEDGYDDDDYEDYDEDDFLARRRADQRRQSERDASDRRQRLVTVGWGALVVFWLITFYVFVFEKERMVYKFPGTQAFYSMFEGVSDKERFRPEEGETLTPSPAQAEVYISAKISDYKQEAINGIPSLVIQGYVENLGTTGASVPQVLVEIVDVNNRVLDQWVTEPAGLIIRRGGKVNFTTTRAIPSGARNVRVSVVEGSKSSTSGEFPA